MSRHILSVRTTELDGETSQELVLSVEHDTETGSIVILEEEDIEREVDDDLQSPEICSSVARITLDLAQATALHAYLSGVLK